MCCYPSPSVLPPPPITFFTRAVITFWVIAKKSSPKTCRPTVGQLSADSWLTGYRQSTDRQSTYISSKTCWPSVGRLSAHSRPTVGWQTTNSQPTVGWQLTDSQPTGFLGSSSSQLPCFESTEALIFTPFRWIVSTIVHFTCNIKGPSNILGHSRCYGLWPIMAALSCHNYLFQLFTDSMPFHTEYKEKTFSQYEHDVPTHLGLKWVYFTSCYITVKEAGLLLLEYSADFQSFYKASEEL